VVTIRQAGHGEAMTSQAGSTQVTDLVARARDGDQQAWEALVERYAPLIWSVCRRRGLDEADAKDVGQSVWLQLVDQLDRIRDPAALAGWLATSTRRECGRVLRAAQRRYAAGYGQEADTLPDEQALTAEEELLAAERHAAVREALADLSPCCQRLITLLAADPAVPYTEAGHPHRQHRAHPPPLPGQAAPPSGHRRAGRRRRLARPHLAAAAA
jgi:RNA polymerase sigma factor (sigma-70 family)